MSATTVSMSNWSRPHVGQAISTGPRWRSCNAFRISQATLTSSSAWNVESEMRIVSPMPSASSVPRPTADFSDPDHFVPASVIPEMQRIRDPLREQAVGRDRVGDVGRLDRDLEVLEVEPLHQLDELDRGTDERLDRVLALERMQVLGQRPRVHPDPQRRAQLGGAGGDQGHLLGPTDVARVEPYAVGSGVERLERQRVVEVNVGDDRDR